ncbi:hypothetical protein [Mucilaginibacter gilvus]|uniref:Uncharacterized protein n=1 Tax=Mucilaginibacter gilvus TaxID=2305909 RepID=A0A444MV05_9SPHI|nr:hypothetical protein [Mucilaginibacter gilvus]RWY57464.1 hypothetical protein EPL05_02750 [Mucilaginibacter gilvus]
MIRVTPNLHGRLVMAFVAIFLLGCSKPGYWKNNEISEGKRDDMHELNDKALDLIKKGDTEILESLLSKELIAENSTDARVKNIGHALVTDTFKRMDEYYVVNKYLGADTIKSHLKDVNAYSLIYPAVTQEMYFMHFIQAKKEVPNKQIITIGYAKYSYGWKIGFMDMQPYGFNGKNAQELYKTAQEQYNKGQLIDALNNMNLAIVSLRPSELWVYDNEAEVHRFYNKVTVDAAKVYKFPTPVDDLLSRPYIISINNKTTREGSFPQITYITKVKLKDTAAIKAENLLIRKALIKLMPGIDKNNQYIYYLAYNQQPTSENYLSRYDMVDKLW